MGIETAIVAGAVGSSLIGSKSASKAAKAQANATTQATDQATKAQLEMFNKGLELMAPFRKAGESALPALQQYISQKAPQFSFNSQDYYNSPEYAALSQQAEQSVLRNASATGGFRSGGANVGLTAIAPQLAQQARQTALGEFSVNQAANQDKFNQLMGIAGIGLGSAQQSASQAGQVGSGLAGAFMNQGNNLANIAGNKYAAQNQALQGVINAGTTAFLGNKMGLF